MRFKRPLKDNLWVVQPGLFLAACFYLSRDAADRQLVTIFAIGLLILALATCLEGCAVGTTLYDAGVILTHPAQAN